MFSDITRRAFVAKGLKAGAVAGLGNLAFLNHLAPVSAADAKVAHARVRLDADTEPLVRLIEDTPRENLFEAVTDQMRQGIGYQQLLTALFLAGVRGIQPRPVGFKFHAVLVVNSAHLASLAAPDTDRWLPLFWALDNFKSSQEANAKQGGWAMAPVAESQVPPGHHARDLFTHAMDNWDEEGADRAICALVRNAGATEVVELFWRYGARDFRDIGHKAIYVANSWRTLQTIGWRHAEPVMRSLAYALLEHKGANPAQRDDEADRPGRDNLKRLGQIRAGWQRGRLTQEATQDLLQVQRKASPAEACDQVVELLKRQVDPRSIWDGLFLRAGELLMQKPGIIGIHCVTSINALHYGYQTSGNDETRRLLLLQAAAFLPMFRETMRSGDPIHEERHLDTLEKVELKSSGTGAVEEILADVSQDQMTAARKTLALVQTGKVKPETLMTAARRLIFSKGTDSHDYKFSSAALEDYYHATKAWRARYLASSMFNLRGSGAKDNTLIERARAALGKV